MSKELEKQVRIQDILNQKIDDEGNILSEPNMYSDYMNLGNKDSGVTSDEFEDIQEYIEANTIKQIIEENKQLKDCLEWVHFKNVNLTNKG